MDTYKGFADFYDRMMDNIPYEEWGDYIISLLKDKGVMPGAHVLELGWRKHHIFQTGYDNLLF